MRHLGVAQSVTGDDGQAYRLISQPVTLTRTPAAIARPAPGWGGIPTRCWPKRATTPPASRACARRAWYERRALAGRRQPAGHIQETLRDGIATLTISNPARRNAMTLAMWRQLAACLARLREAPDLRVLALTGAGSQAFVSGADISEFDQARDSSRPPPSTTRPWPRRRTRWRAFRRPRWR